jgi:hypothetical protein
VIAAQTQIARAGLAAHVDPFNRPLQTNGPGFMWNPTLPAGAMALNGTVQRQAEIIAYADNFLFIGALALSALLVVALIRKPKALPQSEDMHLE